MKYGFKREVAAEIVRTFYNPEEHRRRTGRKHFLEKQYEENLNKSPSKLDGGQSFSPESKAKKSKSK